MDEIVERLPAIGMSLRVYKAQEVYSTVYDFPSCIPRCPGLSRRRSEEFSQVRTLVGSAGNNFQRKELTFHLYRY